MDVNIFISFGIVFFDLVFKKNYHIIAQWEDPWNVNGVQFHETLQLGLLQPRNQIDTI